MLEARHLTKYYSAIPAVRDVSFTLRPGGILGLLGPNGSGKSTTVSMITGLLEPSGGEVWFEGRDIRDAPLAYKARLGYVPEEAHLYMHLTGPEYLSFVGGLRGISSPTLARRIDALLETFGLQDDRHEQLSGFSKGMRQKILISAALLHDPDLIVFDEPCSGLDVTSTLVLRSLVQALAARGKMIVYSSHVLEMVEQVSTEVMILHQSNVVAHDSVSRLRSLLELASLEQVFRKVVDATNVEGVANRVVEAMRL
ncbi:MAG TPA: ABC transporter ATP-binding protein [Vicinamibacterales bacterium]